MQQLVAVKTPAKITILLLEVLSMTAATFLRFDRALNAIERTRFHYLMLNDGNWSTDKE
jgi:hypothetical protein